MVIEKRLNELKIRLTDSEWLAMSQLAEMDDRSMGDYAHHVVALHLFGHEYKLLAAREKDQKNQRA
jgi:hypothetical protein